VTNDILVPHETGVKVGETLQVCTPGGISNDQMWNPIHLADALNEDSVPFGAFGHESDERLATPDRLGEITANEAQADGLEVAVDESNRIGGVQAGRTEAVEIQAGNRPTWGVMLKQHVEGSWDARVTGRLSGDRNVIERNPT
jgi:hypothetical protein